MLLRCRIWIVYIHLFHVRFGKTAYIMIWRICFWCMCVICMRLQIGNDFRKWKIFFGLEIDEMDSDELAILHQNWKKFFLHKLKGYEIKKDYEIERSNVKKKELFLLSFWLQKKEDPPFESRREKTKSNWVWVLPKWSSRFFGLWTAAYGSLQ